MATSQNALRDPKFRQYFTGAVCAVNATWMFRVLLSWSAWDTTHSASFVGIIAALSLLPIAITGPIFGALADRSNIATAYFKVSVGMVCCTLFFLVLSLAGALVPLVLVGVALVFGLILSAHHPVRQSLGPRLVGPSMVGSVVALSALNFNVGRLVSPMIGGVLIATVGQTSTAAIAVVLFLPSVMIARTLTPREKPAKATGSGFLSDLREGFRLAWERWPIRRSLLLSVFALGPVRAISELFALIADGKFEQGAQGFGLLTSALGLGALFAALIQVWLGQGLTRNHTLRYAVIFVGFMTSCVTAFAPNFTTAVAAAPIVGFCGTFVGVSLQIGLQARLEDDLRGRIMSLWMLATTLSTSVLAIVMSALSEVYGLERVALVVMIGAAGVILLIACQKSVDQ